jgi:23S rRNA pseudouridine1911/1915/1917 synthase
MSGTEWRIGGDAGGVRLDKYLADAARLGSRARAVAALERGKVFVNDVEASVADASRRLTPGDVVRVWVDRPGSAKRRPRTGPVASLDVVYEDDLLIAVNKPAGLLSVPLERNPGVPSVYDQIEERFRPYGKRRPFPVHRIDQDTSGLVLFAKSASVQRDLKDLFKRREPERVYWAVVYGTPQPPAGTWRDVLVWDDRALIQKQTHPKDQRGTEAVSMYAVLEMFRDTSLLEVRLHTGRRNQIRIQARLRGHTLVGESRYTYGPDTLRPVDFHRQALHAVRLTIRHPGTGHRLDLEAALPPDLTELLTRLRRQR